jgi:hypothetical protein
MRYSDCPSVAVTTHIRGTAADVWELVSDITLPTRFSSEVRAVDWIDGSTAPEVGARFAGRSEHAAIGGWETTCVVTKLEPLRCFEWSVGDADHPSSIWRFTIVEDDDGVVLEQWFQMGPARSGLNLAIDAMPDKEEKIVARRLEEHKANMQANVDGVKALIEGNAA